MLLWLVAPGMSDFSEQTSRCVQLCCVLLLDKEGEADEEAAALVKVPKNSRVSMSQGLPQDILQTLPHPTACTI